MIFALNLTYFMCKILKIRRPKTIFFRNFSRHIWKPLTSYRLRNTEIGLCFSKCLFNLLGFSEVDPKTVLHETHAVSLLH